MGCTESTFVASAIEQFHPSPDLNGRKSRARSTVPPTLPPGVDWKSIKLDLTDREIITITKTWKDVRKDLPSTGKRVFVR